MTTATSYLLPTLTVHHELYHRVMAQFNRMFLVYYLVVASEG